MAVEAELPCQLGKAIFHGPCSVGAYSYFNGAADIFHADIGRYASIAGDVTIGAGEHPLDRFTTHPLSWGGGRSRFRNAAYDALADLALALDPHKRTIIGSDVWIGAKAIVRQGCHIANGSVVAAGSVVTADVEPFTIVGGVPARPIRLRLPQQQVERLLALAWWDIDLSACGLSKEALADVDAFCERLEACKATGRLKPLKPGSRRYGRLPWRRRFGLR